jgi:hypothetical protein
MPKQRLTRELHSLLDLERVATCNCQPYNPKMKCKPINRRFRCPNKSQSEHSTRDPISRQSSHASLCSTRGSVDDSPPIILIVLTSSSAISLQVSASPRKHQGIPGILFPTIRALQKARRRAMAVLSLSLLPSSSKSPLLSGTSQDTDLLSLPVLQRWVTLGRVRHQRYHSSKRALPTTVPPLRISTCS